MFLFLPTTELVNGFDISDIYARSFMLGIFQNITAIKEFVQDLQTDTIIIHGLVDGIDLDQEAVTLNTSQTLQGAIFFNSITTMNGDLTVTGNSSWLLYSLWATPCPQKLLQSNLHKIASTGGFEQVRVRTFSRTAIDHWLAMYVLSDALTGMTYMEV